MPTKNQIRAGIRKKQKQAMAPPQMCANPNCKADLHDPHVPEEYRLYADLFGLAREIVIDSQTAAWQCPVCSHVWAKHRKPADL